MRPRWPLAWVLSIIGLGWGSGHSNSLAQTAIANQPFASSAIAIKDQEAPVCPADLQALVGLMMPDLPSYANRVSTRSRLANSPIGTYVLIAGRPDFRPLTLGPGEWQPTTEEADEVQQVFLTTLERQYTAGKPFRLQQYHWLFFTRRDRVWYLSMMFSRTRIESERNRPPTPPRDSSDGVLAQAIRLWLRDCYYGALR